MTSPVRMLDAHIICASLGYLLLLVLRYRSNSDVNIIIIAQSFTEAITPQMIINLRTWQFSTLLQQRWRCSDRVAHVMVTWSEESSLHCLHDECAWWVRSMSRDEHGLCHVMSTVYVTWWARSMSRDEHGLCHVMGTVYVTWWARSMSRDEHGLCHVMSTVYVTWWARSMSRDEHGLCHVMSTVYVTWWARSMSRDEHGLCHVMSTVYVTWWWRENTVKAQDVY